MWRETKCSPLKNEQQEQERLFGGNPRIQATLEQVCNFGRSNPAAAQTQPIFRDRESLLRHVVQRTKSLGTWIERIEDGNLHCVDAVVNNAGYKMEAANKVSVKRPGRRSCT